MGSLAASPGLLNSLRTTLGQHFSLCRVSAVDAGPSCQVGSARLNARDESGRVTEGPWSPQVSPVHFTASSSLGTGIQGLSWHGWSRRATLGCERS